MHSSKKPAPQLPERISFQPSMLPTFGRTNAPKFAAVTTRFLLTALVLVCHRTFFQSWRTKNNDGKLCSFQKMHSQWNFFDVPNAVPSSRSATTCAHFNASD